ncbi:MAG: endonuclease/exonuclease/phosphatase family protein [Armatimonadetes bacterium]|nr:endonuclease/exonuclease/phosphatase family protein [Armatimonadota bacterium]
MLRLLSYNVLEGALPNRLPKVLRIVHSAEPDVVAIQEARNWRRNRREVYRRVSRTLGMNGVLLRANSGFDLAVFSKLRILGYQNYGWDTIFLHTAGAVDVQAPNGITFTLFAAHLRPDYPSRREEAKLLLQWMRPYRQRHCAMCGDLNSLTAGDHVARRLIRPDSELTRGPQGIVRAIERAGWVDCFRQHNPAAPGLTLGQGRRVARVDYIFASKALAGKLTGSRVVHHPELLAASDHSPIWADFDI